MKKFNIKPELSSELGLDKEDAVEKLNMDFEEIRVNLMNKYKHLLKEHSGKDETLKAQEEFIAKHGLLAKIEMLNLHDDLVLWINDLFQQRLLTEKEAHFLMRQLKRSHGWDNFTTLALLKILLQMDLYLRENFLNKSC